MVESPCEEILGSSSAASALRNFVREAAESGAPVLLLGEAGTGKELVARRIHALSRRAKEPLLILDCSLYYERELERELFGYRGIGKAAKARPGVLEYASRGTCYLMHVEELSAALQEALVGFLKTGRFRRLGDGKERRSQVRIIASSERNLDGLVASGLFDKGLYAALSSHRARLLPLRERAGDIPEIVLSLARRAAAEKEGPGPDFTEEALRALAAYPWPNNFDGLLAEVRRLIEWGPRVVGPDALAFEIWSYWSGRGGDPQLRKVLEELDGYIREFRMLADLDLDFVEVYGPPEPMDLDLAQSKRSLTGTEPI